MLFEVLVKGSSMFVFQGEKRRFLPIFAELNVYLGFGTYLVKEEFVSLDSNQRRIILKSELL